MTGDTRKKQHGEAERRAKALRDNLHRRKQQARARAQTVPKPAPGVDRGETAPGKPER